MQRNVLIVIVVAIILVIAAGAFALMSSSNNNGSAPNVNAISEKGTKLALYNTGPTWSVVDLTMVNVTMKNGTVQDLHAEVFMKPVNGTVVIDLSQLLGYGNEKLPAGTTIRILSWKGLLNETTPLPNQDLKLDFQGWSNNLDPQSADIKYNVFQTNLPVNKLPDGITDNYVKFGTIQELENLNPDIYEPVFEEEVLTVNEDGTVTIVFTQLPTLCTTIAQIF